MHPYISGYCSSLISNHSSLLISPYSSKSMCEFSICYNGIDALPCWGEGGSGEGEESVEEVGALRLGEVLPVGDGGALGKHIGNGVRDALVKVFGGDVGIEEFDKDLLWVCVLCPCGYGKDGVVASAK